MEDAVLQLAYDLRGHVGSTLAAQEEEKSSGANDEPDF